MDQAGPPSCLELSRVPSVLASVSSGSSNYTATRATTSEFRDEPQVGRTRIVPHLSIEQRKCPILDRRSQRNDALASAVCKQPSVGASLLLWFKHWGSC